MTQERHSSCNTIKRKRGWILTINNPTDEDTAKFSDEKVPDWVKSSAQLEIGKNGTPHIQAAVYYKNAKTFRQMKKLFPRAHIEDALNWNKAYNYCKKDDTRIDGPWLWPRKEKVDKPTFDEFKQGLSRIKIDFYLDRFGL